MTRVLAQATLRSWIGYDGLFYHVTVTGQPPHAQTRTYSIAAKSDTDAAQQGLHRFTEEMEALATPDRRTDRTP